MAVTTHGYIIRWSDNWPCWQIIAMSTNNRVDGIDELLLISLPGVHATVTIMLGNLRQEACPGNCYLIDFLMSLIV